LKTWVYIDGFNLYYGAVRRTPYRWLNLLELSRQVLPAVCQVDRVKYFTARVSGIVDPQAPARQQTYLNALETVPEIQVFFGTFLPKTVWRPIVALPVGNEQIHSQTPPVSLLPGRHQVTGSKQQTLDIKLPQYKKKRKAIKPASDAVMALVHTQEEKGSDVNLGAHLLNDAWKGEYQAAAVISNDTDLCEPIRMVAQEHKIPVTVVCPFNLPQATALKSVAAFSRHIQKAHLVAAQFPATINPNIIKPASW
jgi:hypothetical protein